MSDARLIDVQLHQREARLWRAVIDQAVFDATSTIPPVGETAKSRTKASVAGFDQHQARSWLTGRSKDFRTVCHFAGFDPDQVRAAAKRLEAKGWKL